MTSQCQTQYTSAYGNNCLAILQNSFQNVGRQMVQIEWIRTMHWSIWNCNCNAFILQMVVLPWRNITKNGVYQQ